MTIKPILKIAESLFNDGFIVSKADSNKIFSVLTGETQEPPQEIVEVLEFICKFNEKTRSKVANN